MSLNLGNYSPLVLSNQDSRVTLYWRNDVYTSGNRTVNYSFPYQDGEYVENLGRTAKQFNISAYVDVSISFLDSNTLEKILSSGQLLNIQLPLPINGKRFFESLELGGAYTINRSLQTAGVFEVSIPLIETVGRPKYVQTASKGLFSRLSAKIFRGNEEVFQNSFNAIGKGREVFNQTVNQTREVAIGIRRASQTLNSRADGVNALITSINEVIDNTETLVRTPATLSRNLSNIFQNLANTYENAEDLFDVCQNLGGFTLDTGASNNSNAKQQEVANANAFEKVVLANALALQYQASVNINYESQQELAKTIKELEERFNNLPTNIKANFDLYNSIQEARLFASQFFSDLNVSLPLLTTKQINKQPITLLSYSLYGNLNNTSLLQSLNNITDIMQIEGTINILSNV